ncbi:MAG: hypothetical protein JWL67_1587, partial [Solirubrobacterales bacterium]|nr:hypothetical protein [Solirubrobacterales bacterium]
MIGRDEAAAFAADEGDVHVGSASRELELDIEPLLALHDEDELSVLLLPYLLGRYARRTSEAVLHLPSTVWVLGALEPIEAAVASHHVVLVPRTSTDVRDDGLQPTPAQLEAVGRIEKTIMAVDPSSDARRFLDWWGEHVEVMLGSLDARRSGARPEDRPWLGRFLELAPARFGTAVLDDPGCNLNMWNLHQRDLQATSAGLRVDGRWPLRFMNLPGFEPERPHRLNVAASRARISRSPVLHELSERYAEELCHSGWRDSDHREDVGRRLADGLVYDDS